jgi:hypothetical protein
MNNGIEPSTGDVHPCSEPTAHNLQSTLTALILTLRYIGNRRPTTDYSVKFLAWLKTFVRR